MSEGEGINVGDIVVIKIGGSYVEMKVSQLCDDSAVLKEINIHNKNRDGHYLIVPCEMLMLRRFPLGTAAKVIMVAGKRGMRSIVPARMESMSVKRRVVRL